MILEIFPVGLLRCNCTVLGDETTGEAIVVDPGDDIPLILKRLAAHRLTLKQIVVTHAHIDHVGGALALRRQTGAPVYLNENDLELLEAMPKQAEWLGVVAPEVAAPDYNAVEGTVVGVTGIEGNVLHTPGHTQGSISLHFPKERLLIAGDTLFAGTIGRTDLPGGDMKKILVSVRERLLALPPETRVIAGHGMETTIGREQESNPFAR